MEITHCLEIHVDREGLAFFVDPDCGWSAIGYPMAADLHRYASSGLHPTTRLFQAIAGVIKNANLDIALAVDILAAIEAAGLVLIPKNENAHA